MSAICQKLSLAYGAPLLSPMRTHALRRNADLLRPDVVGLVVVDVDGRPQLFGRKPVVLRQQLPREADRVALEVVAEAEVAEHLEERVVPRRVADVLEVVVLAAGAHAALRGRRAHVGPLVLAEEHVLELDHARVGEQQRRIVRRDERRRTARSCGRVAEKKSRNRRADVGRFHGTRRRRGKPSAESKACDSHRVAPCAARARPSVRLIRRRLRAAA